MSAYKIENLDGSLALVDTANANVCEWLDEIEIVGFPSEKALTVRLSLCSSTDSHLDATGFEGWADIRLVMNEWLEDNGYSISIYCAFADERSLAEATAQASAIRDRFLGGNYMPLDARYHVWWTSAHKRGTLDCGDFITIDEARASLPEMTAHLLRIGNEDDVEDILAGIFSIEARGDAGYVDLYCEHYDVARFAPVRGVAA